MAYNHQNNFGTNLTSNQIAGVTTTPLNSIPSVAAPFTIALDATNINGKYEIVVVTSKTATNINHAATTYAHTTAEEVRMVLGADELDTFVSTPGTDGALLVNAPQGFLINGKISVTDAAGITVAIKTLAGTDPSASDPVYCRIGDTVRTISAALSHSVADGSNWLNAGSAELATKEIDYFCFLGWSTVDSAVHIGFSRWSTDGTVPTAGATNEKGCCVNGSVNSGDTVEVIGRFAATLSAGAGYTWSVPTYTASNLIQRPIYETRWLTYLAGLTWTASAAPSGSPVIVNRYKLIGNTLFINIMNYNYTAGTAVTLVIVTSPFAKASYSAAAGAVNVTSTPNATYVQNNNDNTISLYCTSVAANRFTLMLTSEI